MDPLTLGLLSGGASIFGGLLNRPRDPLQDFYRTSFLTLGANDPLSFANSAYARWLGSPAYGALQSNLFNQAGAFGNQLQGSLANRGLLDSGIGNLIGSLGKTLYGGNLAQAQGAQYSNLANLFPQLLNQRMALAGLGSRPSLAQGLGAGLQGLGNFGLNYLAMLQPQAKGLPGGYMSGLAPNGPMGPQMGGFGMPTPRIPQRVF